MAELELACPKSPEDSEIPAVEAIKNPRASTSGTIISDDIEPDNAHCVHDPDEQITLARSMDTESTQIPDTSKDESTCSFRSICERWTKNSPEVKDKTTLRNEINDSFILKTAVQVTEDNIESILYKGDFLIGRRIWDKSEGKYHDHFVFVNERFIVCSLI